MYRPPQPGDLLLYERSYRHAPLVVLVLDVRPPSSHLRPARPDTWPPRASQVEALVLLPDGRKRVVPGTKLRDPAPRPFDASP